MHSAQKLPAQDARVQRTSNDDEETKGRTTRRKTAKGAVSKAMQGLVGGVAPGTEEERTLWTAALIPRSEAHGGPTTSADEARDARECSWGGGDVRRAKAEMRQAGKTPGGLPGIPWVHMAPLSAPGPSGDRQEHLDDILGGAGASQRRRLTRALDELTVRWATNQLPPACRWMLNTQVLFLKKEREPTSKEFDDHEWLRTLSEHTEVPGAARQWDQDIPNPDVMEVGPEINAASGNAEGPATAAPTRPNVRPIQMGEFLRKWTSRRLLRLNSRDTAKVMAAMRQFGNGATGGTETVAIFHQLVHDLWRAGELERPLARIKVDEKNCFGMLEWPAVRKAAREALPRHYAVACWKHQEASYVEQQGVDPVPKDRGAEQGDVDGPLECSLTLGKVAANTRSAVHAQQRSGDLPWATTQDSTIRAAEREYDERGSRAQQWSNTPPAERREAGGALLVTTDPQHEVQASGGVVDYWYLDDGDVLCDPQLVVPFLRSFDACNSTVGGERNTAKTKVFYYADTATMETNSVAWRLDEVRALASLGTADEAEPTLGVVTGSPEAVEEQLRGKADVVRAMQTRTTICQDTQTEHVLNRQSLGIGRINHILRVHGDQLLQRGTALSGFDTSARETMDRLFPGLPAEGHEQATLAAAFGGLGWRTASTTARPANLAALLQTGPKVRGMAAAAVHAGLLQVGQLEAKLDAWTQRVESAYLDNLDELERVKAEEYLTRVRTAAVTQWEQTLGAQVSASVRAPRADATYRNESDRNPVHLSSTDDGGSADADNSDRRLTVAHVQKELCKIQDCTRLRALESTLTRQGNWPQLDRLRELRHPEVSHRWLWHLDTCDGSVMNQTDYTANIQKRLGARVISGDVHCRLCGALLDPQLEHAEVCATAEATRGHYACVRALVGGLRIADPSVTTEPRGLTTTQARPADILTIAAVPGRSAALDVCIASPNAAAAQGDAAEAAFRRKLRHYRNVIPELAAAGIVFRPLIWTADGRPHPAAVRTLRYAADQAVVRAGGTGDAASLLRRWKHEIMVAILRRRAAMSRAVLPRHSEREEWLLTGHANAEAGSVPRAAGLDADGTADAGEEEEGDASHILESDADD